MNRSFKTGTLIWVYYMDIDSHKNLRVPQLLQGFIGDDYNVAKLEIPGYRFIKQDGELTGTFDMKPHTIKLMYRHENWETVEDVDVFLRIKQPTTVYDTVEGMLVGSPIAPGIVIKAFEEVTTFDHQVWYEVGADQWTKFVDTDFELVDQPFPELDLHSEEPATTNLNKTKLNATGTVNYVTGGSLPIYDKPYGKIVDNAADGVSFTINAELDDENGVKWYHVARRGYVNAMYIDLL